MDPENQTFDIAIFKEICLKNLLLLENYFRALGVTGFKGHFWGNVFQRGRP